jgi:hypothetical protein
MKRNPTDPECSTDPKSRSVLLPDEGIARTLDPRLLAAPLLALPGGASAGRQAVVLEPTVWLDRWRSTTAVCRVAVLAEEQWDVVVFARRQVVEENLSLAKSG